MRIAFVLIIIAVGIVQSFRSPFFALLFYLWIAYFRPEGWLWSDLLYGSNLSLAVGIFVLVRMVFSSERWRFGAGPLLMCLFLAHSLASTLMSPAIDYAWPYWIAFAKSVVISLLIFSMVTDERRLRLTFLVIALSLGLEAAKQGFAQLVLNPGGANQNEIAILGDNNFVAVGMMMLVSLYIALASTAPTRKERLFHRFMAFGVFYRGMSTYSRGGFLSSGTLGIQYVIRSRRKAIGVVVTAIAVVLVLLVLPQDYWDRMNTIRTASQDVESADASIQSRVHFWQVALRMAEDRPIFGVGHNAYNAMYDRYDFSGGRYQTNRSVHSIWFGVLAELGYPGLFLYVAVLGYSVWQCTGLIRRSRSHPELQSLVPYAAALEGALLALAVGGTFVIFQYNEMAWHMFALAMVTGRLAADRLAATPRESSWAVLGPPPHVMRPPETSKRSA